MTSFPKCSVLHMNTQKLDFWKILTLEGVFENPCFADLKCCLHVNERPRCRGKCSFCRLRAGVGPQVLQSGCPLLFLRAGSYLKGWCKSDIKPNISDFNKPFVGQTPFTHCLHNVFLSYLHILFILVYIYTHTHIEREKSRINILYFKSG